jgi:hypothetical protein
MAIVELSCAAAVAVPPALTVGGAKITRSHRTCSAWANADGALPATQQQRSRDENEPPPDDGSADED